MAAPPVTPDARGAYAGRATAETRARADQIQNESIVRARTQGGTRVDPETWTTAVAAGTRFDGLLAFHGRAQIDGELKGGVVCRGTLRVGTGARIEGTIEADEVVVLGRLRGDVVARRRIELGATARVTGSIRAPSVKLQDGCWLNGRCEMPPPEDAPRAD